MKLKLKSARWLAGLLSLYFFGLNSIQAQEPEAAIDDCRYETDSKANAAWQPMAGSPSATMAVMNGEKTLRLGCPFANSKIDRASWDRQVQLNLTACRGIEFQFFCRDASPVSYFSLYFQSGDGWYVAPFFPQMSGWNTIAIDKTSMNIEGQPAGWGAIKTIRLSAWRGGDANTEFNLRYIRKTGLPGADTMIALVRCDSAAQTRPNETNSVREFTANIAAHFDGLGIGYAMLSDTNLAPEQLRHVRLVVLPHNPIMPDQAVETLAHYLGEEGRLLAFYGMPERLRTLTKIGSRGHVKPERPGEFTAIRFAAGALAGSPSVVNQKSWNIVEPKALPGLSREIGQWLDETGQPSGHAAVVASSNAVEVSHVLLKDDSDNKRRMLLAMAGSLVPEIWLQAVDHNLARIGRMAGYRGFDEAAVEIAKMSGRDSKVAAMLSDARGKRENALKLRGEGRYSEACDHATEAAKRMLEAFYSAQQPASDEFRAFWCHSAFGVDGMSWDAAIQRLADNGFTAILPNMLWGGVAYYGSAVLPVAPEVATRGDQMAQCLEACKKRGLQAHVWKVNWNLSRAPREFVERMRREGRLQADSRGKEEPWLCPSHPDNRKLEIDSMVELVRRYEVDGIHFDYIRYPDGDHCFCNGCKERFSQMLGSAIRNWPQDALKGGPHHQTWLNWRRGNITQVVKAVSEQAHALKPKVKISAAVFANYPVDRDGVGQDWKLWCELGYLDFVCPMDYTASDAQFENWVRNQKVWAAPVPCYPGIGAWVLTPDRVVGQVQITRKHDTKGFVIFNYDTGAARDLAPALGMGLTKKP
jgi:uncharacterized lipoprotein YddW (UPF0748 family)